MTLLSNPPGDLWVFAYGSLMWRPGFDYLERHPARLTGLHRSLCVYSFVHRGTPERPGLVLGLDRGGACRGIAYRVAAGKRADTIAYLRQREQVTKVYIESVRDVTLMEHERRRVSALVYLVDRGHPQYAGKLSLEQQLHHIRRGAWKIRRQSGLCAGDRRRTGIVRMPRRESAPARRAPEGLARNAARADSVTSVVSSLAGAFALRLGDKPRGRRLDVGLHARKERLLVEPGRDRIADVAP